MSTVYELQDKAFAQSCNLTDTVDSAIKEAYELGKRDGAREAMDVSQYVTAEPCDCEDCQSSPTEQLLAALDEIASDGEYETCPCGCGLTVEETGEDPDDLFFSWTPDVSADEYVDDPVYIDFGDGAVIPLSTVIEMVADDLSDLASRNDALTERIEALEYEAGVKYVGG